MILGWMPRAIMAGALFCALGAVPSRATVIDDFNRGPSGLYQVSPTVGNGWVEVESPSDSYDVGIIRYPVPNNGVMQLRDYLPDPGPDAQATLYHIALPANLINIQIAFQYLGHATGIEDLLYVQWKLSSESEAQWHNPLPGNGAYTLESSSFKNASFKLPDGTTEFDLRFWTDVTDSTSTQEKDQKICVSWYRGHCSQYVWTYKTVWKPASHDQTAKIDNIEYTASERAPDPTPIPGALPLFLSGAAMFGGLMYRRKRKAQAAA
jgi:hypothetical protein